MTIEEIKKLASLARIDMSEKEMEGLASDFDPILSYVGQVQEALKVNNISDDKSGEDQILQNVFREDIVTNKSGEYKERILSEVPETQDGFLKVKKIL